MQNCTLPHNIPLSVPLSILCCCFSFFTISVADCHCSHQILLSLHNCHHHHCHCCHHCLTIFCHSHQAKITALQSELAISFRIPVLERASTQLFFSSYITLVQLERWALLWVELWRRVEWIDYIGGWPIATAANNNFVSCWGCPWRILWDSHWWVKINLSIADSDLSIAESAPITGSYKGTNFKSGEDPFCGGEDC